MLGSDVSEFDLPDRIKDINIYAKGWSYAKVADLQAEFLLDLWDGRDAYDGGSLKLWQVRRHHYVVLWFQGSRTYSRTISMKFDCRLVALVPLSTLSHGHMLNAVVAKRYETYFRETMEKLMNGEWATPYWWEDADAIRSFEKNLERLGYVRPS